MKKVLVTGAGGFIGSHLVEQLLRDGKKVRAMVRYNSSNSWGWLEAIKGHKNLEVITGDVRDFDSTFSSIKGCDSVFHLAALIGIPYSYVSPLAYLKTNVEGTYNVLQSAKELGLKDILVTSTSETYGTAQFVPISELHPMVGQSPYSASKIGADQLAISFHRSFGLPVKIVRPFNTYGPRQSNRAIIPTIITQVLAGQKSIRLGNLTPTRDLTYVEDTVAGFMAIQGAKQLEGEITNIGMGQEISIGELANRIFQLMNVKVKVQAESQRVRPKDSEVERLLCDVTKLKDKTNWSPKFTLDKGLNRTIEFLKGNLNRYKPEVYGV